MKIDGLYFYPVKSCCGYETESAVLEERGFTQDRNAMIVDATGKFITQRTHGKMAKIKSRYTEKRLALTIEGNVYVVTWSGRRRNCDIWNDQVDLVLANDEINGALSAYLDEPVALVSMDRVSRRVTSGNWAHSPVNLSDGYPLLITNSASLEDLSKRAGIPLSMVQFRPNIIVKHDEAWAEDQWKVLRIGEVEIELVKPCTRCQVTTLEPETGQIAFPETMQAMIKNRRSADDRVKGVLFGWNGIIRRTGQISKGDDIEVVDRRTPWPIQ